MDEKIGTLQEAVNSLIGTDITTFASQFAELQANFNAFMQGSSADDVINTLSEIQSAITNLQTAVNNRTTEAQVRAIVDDMFADISEVEF